MRSVERAVYSRVTWNGVHSSNTRARSEPSAACTSIDVSGAMKRFEPSMCDRNVTPRSSIRTALGEPVGPPVFLISAATFP